MAGVWITGASSGLGMYTAREVRRKGYTVISGARSFEGNEGESEEGWRLPLDVADENSVRQFCAKARSISGEPDVLICCAGILILGSCEGYSPAELEQVMKTDFYGQVNMIRQVLPGMRERKSGKIICFSSVNGVLSTPFEGAYSAAKHALEGFCEALRMEVSPWNIQVMLVEPGDHRGGSARYRAVSVGCREGDPYRASLDRVHRVIDRDESGGSDPEKLGRIVAGMLGRKRLPMRRCIAMPSQHLALCLHDLLPGDWFYRFLSAYYHVKNGN